MPLDQLAGAQRLELRGPVGEPRLLGPRVVVCRDRRIQPGRLSHWWALRSSLECPRTYPGKMSPHARLESSFGTDRHTLEVTVPLSFRVSAFALLLPSALLAQAPASPRPAATTKVGPPSGTVIVVGGGSLGPEIYAEFIAAAGGPDA